MLMTATGGGAGAIVVGNDQAARRRRHREPAKEVAGDVLALASSASPLIITFTLPAGL